MSHGIYAQSVGGGGGSGGLVISGTLNMGSGGSNTTIGGNAGNGGSGGNGGDVVVNNTGAIIINNNSSVGVFAQSVGGGGGSGGISGALNVNGSTLGNQVGGNGGKGGDGGNVTVISTGTITTTGDNSVSVLAQSIGGGGGNAGLSLSAATADGGNFNVGGGNVGNAGSKGTVIVQISGGMLQTGGALAYGMLAQSIGAGGGNSGASVPDPLIIGSSGIAVQEGATGAISGDGNQIQASNSNTVVTLGAGASGIVQQSIGGGGGTNGFTGDVSGTNIGALAVTIGGTSSGGGSSNTIQFQNTGDVTTFGDNALGIVAQGIGGGGGLGTFTALNVVGTATSIIEMVGGSEGGTNKAGALQFTAPLSGAYNTSGVLSTAVLAQSIGGGGGYAGFVARSGVATASAQITVGGLGGTGGDGQDFALPSSASISTTGAGALGLVAQSIGGGGGFAGMFGVSGPTAIVLGGSAGAAGNGGAVTVTSSGPISTSGAGAHAILAQSIGGGGGFTEAFSSNGTLLSLPVSAGAGGGGGNGGAVSVTTSGPIVTTGAGAFGIVAQSVGGGGGIAGSGYYKNALGSTAFAGTAGAAGTGGTVDVNVSASVITLGESSTAIFADSDGGTGASNINVTVGAVKVIGGTGDGHAVSLLGGANNTITNFGALATVDGLSGLVITGGIGNDLVINNCFVIGSVDLDGGLNAFDNRPTGVFISGSTVNLGASGLLTNQGVLLPGGWSNVFTTNITGSLKQTVSGVYGTDVEFANQTADRINATGTGDLTGKVTLNLLNPGLAQTGAHDVTIVQAAGGITNHSGLVVDAPTSAVATYTLVYPNATDVVLRYVINFSPAGAGLTENQHSVGNAINAIQSNRGSPNFVKIAEALFFQPDVPTLARVYDSISGEGVTATIQSAFSSNDRFLTSVGRQMSFWLNDVPDDSSSISLRSPSYGPGHPAFNDVVVPRTWRVWGSGYGGGTRLQGDGVVGTATMTERDAGFAMGLDYQINHSGLIGFAVGGGFSSFNVTDRQTSGNVDGGHLAAYGALRNNDLYATAIVSYDFFNNSESRYAAIPGRMLPPLPGTNLTCLNCRDQAAAAPATIPGFAERLSGDFFSQSVSGRAELGYRYRFGPSFSITPFGALQFGSLHMTNFTESAGGGPSIIGLSYHSRTNNTLPSFLGAQFDAETYIGGGRNLSSWARLSWVHEFDTRRTIENSFIAAPGYSFVIEGARAPSDSARANIGARLSLSKNFAIFGSADGDFSSSGLSSFAGMGGMRISW
jgi:uncharacterized protein with beta-barrel porin domain